MAQSHPQLSPHKRRRPFPASSAMVRSDEAELIVSPRPKRRPQLQYSPTLTPPPRSRKGSSRQSTDPTARRRPCDFNALPRPVTIDIPSDEEVQPIKQGDIEMVSRRHPNDPSKPFPGFQRGNLVQVRMQDFLTFTDTIIHPGPRMNLVIGPNGTGKSTIANAVCIVFGGSPRLLGRSTDLGSFVRHGRTKASVEAHVFDPSARNSVVVVKRVFDADGKGLFYLDGEKVTKSDIVKKVIRRFDIQLDNLSQFMPQEKIQEFTNFKPDELLSITVRSLGGAEKEKTYHELTELDSTIGTCTDDLARKEEKLAELQEKQEIEAEGVQAYLRQQEARKTLKLYTKYLPFLEGRELKEQYMNELRKRKVVEEEYAEMEDAIKNANRGPINACEQELDSAAEAVKAAKDASKEVEQETLAGITKTEELTMKLSRKSKELQDKEASASRKQQALHEAEQKLLRMQNQYAEATEDVKERQQDKELKQLNGTVRKIRLEQDSIRSQHVVFDRQREDASRAIKHLNYKLERLGNVRQERIRTLERNLRSDNLGKCETMIREMKAAGKFRGEVCGPVGAEIEVDSSYHARVMEASLSGWYMSAFVTEYSSDSRLLTEICRGKFKGWSPDIITVPTTGQDEIDVNRIAQQKPRRSVDDGLRELGIDRMVSDIYSCPNAVRAALNAQLGLHNIHVGNQVSDRCLDRLREEGGIDAWFTPTARCQLGRSKYDAKARNVTIEHKFEKQTGSFFSSSVQSAERERDRLVVLIREEEGRRDTAGEAIADHEAQRRGLAETLQTTEAAVRENRRRRDARKTLEGRLVRQKEFVEAERRRVEDFNVTIEKASLRQEIRLIEEEAAGLIPSVTEALHKLRLFMRNLDDKTALRISADRALKAEMSRNSAVEESLKEKQRERELMRKSSKEAKAIMRARMAEAEQSLSKMELREHEELFAQLDSRDSEWLRTEIANQTGRVAGLTTGGEDIVRSYEKRQRLIGNLSSDIEQERTAHESRLSELRSRKAEFLTWLRTGIDKMRKKFSSLYQRLGCAGDLELINTDSDSIGALELQILVSYRDNVQLRPISASANSGGEKMCCTMLFVFSLLQEEERMPPFVFVDELNQGLDPSNELKIMKMMFEDAENDVAPQSFVITPKLLLNLPFHSRTKTHIIFNGTVSGKLDVTAPQPV